MFQLAHELLRIVLYIFKYLLHRLAVDDLVDMVGAVFHRDVSRRRIAEEIVHVTEDLLVSTHEERPDIVRLSFTEWMHGEHTALRTIDCEVGHLAIRVARDILQRAVTCRLLVETFYRHDGEKLVDTPTVGKRLEEGEVAEILVGEKRVEATKLIGHMLHALRHRVDLMTHAPIHGLNLRTCLEVYHAVSEHVKTVLTYLVSIVPVLQHRLRTDVAPYIIEVAHKLMVGGLSLKLLRHLRKGGHTEDIQDEHGMVSS